MASGDNKTKKQGKVEIRKISSREQIRLLQGLVEELAGVGASVIVEILYNKKDVNEFNIAKRMNLTINQVRNILYKLSADGLVSFIRKKDKRKGWYIYYWTLGSEKCLVKLEQALMKKIADLNALLRSRETKRFYVCKPCGIEVSEEKALEHGFSCEECAEVYELADNTPSIRDTKAKITKTEKDLQMIRHELDSIREKTSKKRQINDKKEEKEKKDTRDKARSAAKKIRDAAKGIKGKKLKKPVKKTAKKKTASKKVNKKAKAKKKK